MRIIAGKYKGRHIDTLREKGKNIRPTTGVAREALFNILSHGQFAVGSTRLLEGARVLDLFCGSGALAIEAISRGASHAVLVDIDKEHLDIARTNVKKLGAEQNTTFIRADSSSPPPAHMPCNLVFIDPPYNKNLAQQTLANLIKGNWLANNCIIVVETAKKEDLSIPGNFIELDNRNYGNSRIRILRWHEQENNSE